MKPCKYIKKSSGNIEYGLIADEVEDIIPEIVSKTDKEDLLDGEHTVLKDCASISYTKIIPHLIASIQELQRKIEILEQKIENKKEKD